MDEPMRQDGSEVDYPTTDSGEHNPAAIYLNSLQSEHSRRNLGRYLDQVAHYITKGRRDALGVDWSRLREKHISVIVAYFAEEYAPSTVNGMLSAIRGVMGVVHEQGLINDEVYEAAISVPNLKISRSRSSSEHEISHEDVRKILATCRIGQPEQDHKDMRDAAIIGLMYATGMLRSELVALRAEHYDPESGHLEIEVGQAKHRAVLLRRRPKALLNHWLEIRGVHPGALFHPINKGGTILRKRGISAQAIYNMFKERGESIGIEGLSPLDFRRIFVTSALEAGVDEEIVAEIAGHASVDTTRRYQPREDEEGEG